MGVFRHRLVATYILIEWGYNSLKKGLLVGVFFHTVKNKTKPLTHIKKKDEAYRISDLEVGIVESVKNE